MRRFRDGPIMHVLLMRVFIGLNAVLIRCTKTRYESAATDPFGEPGQ